MATVGESPVRMFFVSHTSANTRFIPGSRIWYVNLNTTLIDMGIQLVEPSFDVAEQHRVCVHEGPNEAMRAYYSERLVADVEAAHREKPIDVFFSYYYSDSILPEAIERIKALGIPTVNFYCNAVHQFDKVAGIAPHFDFCMVPERKALPKYEAVGARPVHIQMAANPCFYKPYNLPLEYDVTFSGQNYLNRSAYLGFLYANGVDVRIWGAAWQPERTAQPQTHSLRSAVRRAKRSIKRMIGRKGPSSTSEHPLPAKCCGPPLSDQDMVKLFSRSKISLGLSETLVNPLTGVYKRHVRLRDFEAPMSGAFYLTGYQEELAEYYDIGREIVCYDTKEELLDKVRYYLSHASEVSKIRQAGLLRARRDHTWENRFQQLFKAIGLKSS